MVEETLKEEYFSHALGKGFSIKIALFLDRKTWVFR